MHLDIYVLCIYSKTYLSINLLKKLRFEMGRVPLYKIQKIDQIFSFDLAGGVYTRWWFTGSANLLWLLVKMGMGRPGPSLGSGPMASSPILGVMGRPIFLKCYGLNGPLGIMGRPKYFFYNHKP